MIQFPEGDRVAIYDRGSKLYYRTISGEVVLWTKDLGDAMKFEQLTNILQSLIRIGRHVSKHRQNPVVELHIIKRKGWVKIGTITHF